MNHVNFSPILTEKQITDRVKEIGADITKKLKGEKPLALCILKGSFMFYSDLIRTIDLDMTCEFMGASSYGQSTKSSGEVRLTLDLSNSVKGRHVLLIEDIIDTGLTMAYLQKVILSREPASLTTISLLHKPKSKKVDCQIDYTGFEIGDEFVVGYGLDYQGKYRNLPFIGQVNSLN